MRRYSLMMGLLLLSPMLLTAQTWERLTPDWDAVQIEYLLETGDGSIYAAGSDATLLKSDDNGKTWRKLNLSFGYRNLKSMTCDDVYIYISAESFDWYMPGSTGTDSLLRLFRYDMQSKSFDEISIKRELPESYTTYPLIRPPLISCSNKVLFVTEQRTGNYPCVLRRSSNQGKSWQELEAPGEMWSFETITDDILISASVVANGDTVHIHRSSDGGTSWKITWAGPRFAYYNRIPLSICGDTDSAKIAIGIGSEILLSENAGVSWRKITTIPWNNYKYDFVYAIHIDATGTITVIGKESDVYGSADNGQHWVQLKEYDQFQTATSVLIDSLGVIIIGNTQGYFYRSESSGLTWETLRKSDLREISRIHFFDRFHGFIQAKDMKNTTEYYTTNNGGEAWRRCSTLPNDIRDVIASISNESALYGYGMSVVGDSTIVAIYYSTNLGDSWDVKATSTFPGKTALNDLYDAAGIFLFSSPNLPQDRRIWYSNDTGKSWNYNPLTSRPQLFAHTQDSSGAITLYRYESLATSADVYLSQDSGRTWQDTGFFADSSFRIRTFQATTPNDLFCKVDWRDLSTGQGSRRQYISKNGGKTWQTIRETIGYLDYSTTIFCGDIIYWYYFSPLQISRAHAPWLNEEILLWKYLSGSQSCFFVLDQENIWVASGPTIYRTTNGGVNWVQQPFTVTETAAITDIYPNPVGAGQSVAISIAPPQSPHVMGGGRNSMRIAVYDLLGREVAVLYNGNADPGTRTLTWRPSGVLPAGLYMVRMSLGERVWAKQVAVVR